MAEKVEVLNPHDEPVRVCEHLYLVDRRAIGGRERGHLDTVVAILRSRQGLASERAVGEVPGVGVLRIEVADAGEEAPGLPARCQAADYTLRWTRKFTQARSQSRSGPAGTPANAESWNSRAAASANAVADCCADAMLPTRARI